jgi:hypothetical protein
MRAGLIATPPRPILDSPVSAASGRYNAGLSDAAVAVLPGILE